VALTASFTHFLDEVLSPVTSDARAAKSSTGPLRRALATALLISRVAAE
jgi:hypothetical protein